MSFSHGTSIMSNNIESLDDEADTELSLSDIYNKLQEYGELILTIPLEQEATLRKGLASVKAKQNAKIKEQGLQPDPSSLSYQTTSPGSAGKDSVDVQITLAKRTSIKVLNISIPDKEF